MRSALEWAQVQVLVADGVSEREIALLNGQLSDGIVPKLQAAVVAAREGVRVDIGRTTVVA